MAAEQEGPAGANRPDKSGAKAESGSMHVLTDPPDPSQQIPVGQRGPLTGRVIDGRYRVLELAGEGGMGAVYRALHTLMDKEVAIKVLLPEYSAFEGLARRFRQEAQSASRLDHPGIIQVYDFGQTDDHMLYLAMAYLEGPSLSQVIADEAPLPLPRALRIARQMAEALGHAHEQGVVHRDLKPDNVIVTEEGTDAEQVKLLDFGIAKITQGKGAATGLTEIGAVFGTPEYLSPEQAAGDPVDPRSDLYSLGVILHELLSGQKLFDVDSNQKYLAAHINESPRPLRALVPGRDIPEALDRVVLKLLAKSPADRYQTADELLRALDEAMTPGAAAVGPAPEKAAPPKKAGPDAVTVPDPLDPVAHDRRRLTVGVLVVVVVALVALVAALSLVLSDETPPARVVKNGESAPQAASDAQLQIVAKMLADKQLDEAEQRLNKLLKRAPRDARVHLMFGHLHLRRKKAEACLAAYNTALVLDKTVREDATLVANLEKLLAWPRGRLWGRPDRERAVAFVLRVYDKAPVVESLVKAVTHHVNRWWEHDLVWKLIGLLQKHQADGGVKWPHAYYLRLRSVDSCDKRRQFIQEMVERADKSLLPLLGRVYSEHSFKKPWVKRWVSNRCVQDLAAAAIKSMGGTLPAIKPHRPAPRRRVRPRKRPRKRPRRRRR